MKRQNNVELRDIEVQRLYDTKESVISHKQASQDPESIQSVEKHDDLRIAANITESYLGGFEGGSSAALIFPVPRGEMMKRIIFGNRAALSIRNRVSNWKTFLSVYCSDSDSIDRYHIMLVRHINEMLNTDFPADTSISNLCTAFEKIMETNIVDGLEMTYTLYEPLSLAIRSVFMIWKNHLEHLIIRYNETLSKSKSSKHQGHNDIASMMHQWNILDKKYKIDSSSVLLTFVFNPESPSVVRLTSNAKNWIPAAPKFIWGSDQYTEKFLNAAKQNKFRYIGFCSRRPFFRLNELMKFPIKELITAIRARGGSVGSVEYDNIVKKITPILSTTLPKIPSRPKKFNTHVRLVATKHHSFNHLKLLVEQHLNAAQYYLDYLELRENMYIQLADMYIQVGHVLKRYCRSC